MGVDLQAVQPAGRRKGSEVGRHFSLRVSLKVQIVCLLPPFCPHRNTWLFLAVRNAEEYSLCYGDLKIRGLIATGRKQIAYVKVSRVLATLTILKNGKMETVCKQ